eukprot:TRINITY_DN5657_c0_g1_i1.p1 TRINITY_DN5657_c0_g1~~TRINITY_DN5657_c0_g1_i1.p1  ORF type:complete len:87 (+),score=12.68 TRINITY_DN5657_c0_g1_i1:156-416(+)
MNSLSSLARVSTTFKSLAYKSTSTSNHIKIMLKREPDKTTVKCIISGFVSQKRIAVSKIKKVTVNYRGGYSYLPDSNHGSYTVRNS